MKKHFMRLELDKILSAASAYASLESGREAVLGLEPTGDLAEARRRLSLTAEALSLLFRFGAGKKPSLKKARKARPFTALCALARRLREKKTQAAKVAADTATQAHMAHNTI